VDRVPWWIKLMAVVVSVASILSGLSRHRPVPASRSSTVEILDPFADVAATVVSLHRRHQRAECLLRAGIWEPERPDAARFDPAVLGSAADGLGSTADGLGSAAGGGRWLDIRASAAIAPILGDRLALCVAKGFDGVRFTGLDGYRHDTGFPLTAADQAAFNRVLRELARDRGLTVSEDEVGDGVGTAGTSTTSGS
jgi:hypothetical protein